MTDRRQFFKHTLIFGVGGIVGQLVPVILLPLYTHYLTPGDYGVLSIIYLASDIISTVFFVGGIRLAAMTFYKQAESEEARRRVAVTVSLLLWIAVAVAITLSFCFIDSICYFLRTDKKELLALGLAVTLLEALVAIPMTLTQARLESLRFVITNLTISFARLGLNIFFIAGLKFGILGIFYAQAIVLCVSIVYLTLREIRIGSIYPNVAQWKEVLQFSLPLVPNGILAFLYELAGWFAIMYLGPYESEDAAYWAFGLYALAGRLIQVTAILGVKPMQQVWTAEMYDIHKTPEASAVFGNFALRLLCVQAFAALGLAMFSHEIVRILCDSSYHQAAILIPFFALNSMVALFNTQMHNTFFIMRKTNYNLFGTIYSLPFIYLFMFLLVPHWGIMGAAIGFLLANIVNAGIVYRITQRFFHVRYPFNKMAKLLAITLLCYGLSLLCGSGVETFETQSKWEKIAQLWYHIQWLAILNKTGILILWGVLLWFSGILSQEDKALAIRILKRGLDLLHIPSFR